jgi:biopolymer transport protein ExbD
MASIQDGDDEILADINITPMVDIMLVLLIIFMVTAATIMDDSIKIELPEAATGDETEGSLLGVTIDADGGWHLNGNEISEQGLRDFIQSKRADDDELQAIIAADRGIAHGDVIHLIDVVKQEGVTKFAINIDPPSLPAPGAATPDPGDTGNLE